MSDPDTRLRQFTEALERLLLVDYPYVVPVTGLRQIIEAYSSLKADQQRIEGKNWNTFSRDADTWLFFFKNKDEAALFKLRWGGK